MDGHIVCKFGGTSLADADQFKKVMDIVRSDPRRRHIVASAPGKRHKDDTGVTNMLYELYKLPRDGGDRIPDLVSAIADRFEHIANGLALSFPPRAAVHAYFRLYANRATPDGLASVGELLSARLLAEALGFEFVDAAKIVRFDEHGKFDMEATRANRDRILGDATGYVIPGFYGTLPGGNIKTFSRGGSDLTGAIVAAIVGADLYENWTDVSGIMMTSPRIVPDARKIDVIGRRELRELAYMGAEVLHEQTVLPLRGTAIPIQVRNTNRPEDPGTMVVPDELAPQRAHGTIVGVAGRRGFTAITVEKTAMNDEVGFIRKVCGVFERHGVNIDHLPGGIDTLCVVVDTRALRGKTDLICRELQSECALDHLDVRPNIALVCTVGNAMVHAHGVASRLFAAIDGAGVSVSMIDQGTNERNIVVGIKEDEYEKVVTAIYRAFTA